jgi:hypothetical protein
MVPFTLEVLQPNGSDVQDDGSVAAHRVDTLDGKRIGLVWNNKDYGDKLLEKVQELLEDRYPNATFNMWRLKECCVPPPEGELERIGEQVDAVVYTLGD